jgi:hypothetical protein
MTDSGHGVCCLHTRLCEGNRAATLDFFSQLSFPDLFLYISLVLNDVNIDVKGKYRFCYSVNYISFYYEIISTVLVMAFVCC